jgi:outer membrane immunogenic protein
MRKALIAALAAFVGMGTSAYAADLGGSMKDAPVYDAAPQSWTGLYIGVGIGAGASNTEVDVNVGDFNVLNFDGIGGEGIFGTVQLGYDYQLSSRLVIGGFFDYDFANVNSELTLNPGDGSFEADLDLENMWSIGARLGWLATPDTLWYALVAYTQAQYELSDNVGLFDEIGFDVDEFDGWTVGLGVETRLTSNWSLKAEYRYTQFDGETVLADEDSEGSLDFEPSVHTARAVLSYRFNPFHRGLESAK